MKIKTCSFCSLSLSVAIFCGVLISSVMMRGQDASTEPVGIPDDWTHHHVVYSNPGTAEDAYAKGEFDKWEKVTSSPRYKIQQLRRKMGPRMTEFAPEVREMREDFSGTGGLPGPKTNQTLKKDWSMLLGGTDNVVGTFTSNGAIGSSSVTVDGTLLDASAPVAEIATLSFSALPAGGSSVAIGGITYNFVNASPITTPGSGCNIRAHSTSPADTTTLVASNLTGAITNGTSGSAASTTTWECAAGSTPNTLASATSSTNTVTLTAKLAGSTGFAETPTGTTNSTFTVTTAATNGTQNGSTWTYWSGAAAVNTAQLAANVASTINTNSTLKTLVWAVAGTNSSSQAVVTVYAQASGSTSYTTAASLTGFSWSGSFTGNEAATAGLQNEEWFPLTYFYSTTYQGQCDNLSPSADYVAFPTGVAGSANQPTIIAFDNLYTGCSTGAVPNLYWQYNTGTGYTMSESPVVSLDGKQVAFIQTNGTSNAAQLVILRWAKNAALQQLTSTSSYANSTGGCAAPCMVAIAFADGHYDTTSAPFYDYASDTLYVGDTELTGGASSEGQGYLHKFTNVFNTANGTTQPAEVTTTWPVLISNSNPTATPVLDDTTNEVLIGPTGIPACSGKTNCGENFHEVNTSTGTVTNDTHSFNGGGNTGQTDSPLLDPYAGYAYTFTPADLSGNAAVWQYHVDTTTDFQNSNTEVTIGAGYAANNQFSGAFDNLYYTGAPTGNLYVCGRATGTLNTVTANTIWQIPITTSTNAMGTPVAGPAVATAGTTCSAVTEYSASAAKDYIFFSVQGSSPNTTQVPCGTGGGGCIISFNVVSGAAFTGSTVANSANAVAGGTGALAVDNAFTTPSGEGNVYFFPLSSTGTCTGTSSSDPTGQGTGTCGIQALQSNLTE